MTSTQRQTGLTTRQMRDAPRAAVYVWCNDVLAYPRALARTLGRSDLLIVSPTWIRDRTYLRHNLEGLVRDHATTFTAEESALFQLALGRVRIRYGQDDTTY